MTWLDELRVELHSRGIRGRYARRIELELVDHLACDPEAALGSPAEVAERFVVELRLARTRHAAKATFGALALAAALLFVATAAISGVTGGPTSAAGTQGTVVAFAGLGLLAACQIALVAGTLALVRGLRATEIADLALVQRRSSVALAAGGCVCVALLVDGVLMRPASASSIALALARALLPLPALAVAALRVRAAARLTPAAGPAPALAGDLPGPLRRHPDGALLALGMAAVAFVVVGSAVAEHSLVEGLNRGLIEATGLVVAVVRLGRPLGLRR